MQTTGKYINLEGEQWYLIENYDQMQPFFISLASDTDLWMYLSSTGGLTCGRRNPDQALFPYYTDDKVTENYIHTGPKTIIRVNGKVWEPFSNFDRRQFDTTRSIMKSVVGNEILFSEENRTLGLTFSYLWVGTDKFGWIRKATLRNDGEQDLEIELIDGVQNVLPSGTNRVTQNTYSCLVDGYKKTELVPGTDLMLFRMEAIMVDRAEPSESLRCNTAFTLGLGNTDYLCSSRQLDAFRAGETITPETESKGVRGAILAHTKMTINAGESRMWYMALDVEKDACDVHELLAELRQPRCLLVEMNAAIANATDVLRQIVEQNDGVQLSGDPAVDARHFANVLFNTMRGGYYIDSYTISSAAFAEHVRTRNIAVFEQHRAFLKALPEWMSYTDLDRAVHAESDPQLRRLLLEYLPLTFGRRHGDPSRPWNLFDIRVKDNNGQPIISYQGNWRDIFQNWEALSVSYPGYVNGIIAKFLNATTIDGYNPYKVTSDGIDWEVINPDDPWSNIGYWGDHQIIYLQKLLELSYAHDPKAFRGMLAQRLYAFANVPYRLKSYDEIVADPKNSIRFDDHLHQQIERLVPQFGTDAKLVLSTPDCAASLAPRRGKGAEGGKGAVLLVSFTEKILVTLLAKLSNFVPEGGIWMNTLRPEWNDANNALVGNGASMVTLCYMRRMVEFLIRIYRESEVRELPVATELMSMVCDMTENLLKHQESLENGFTDQTRRTFTDAMGRAGENYRKAAYAGLSGEQELLQADDLVTFLESTLEYIDQSIRVNLRPDGLYNAYNILAFGEGTVGVSYLYQMLEGQVAVLSSGVLSAEESVALLDAMRQSDIYREDQNSYMLYPARRRASFLEMNNIPADAFTAEEQQSLLAADIIRRDCEGGLHFNPSFNNVEFVKKYVTSYNEKHPSDRMALALSEAFWGKGAEGGKGASVFEHVFHHAEFTGRSGTFYKYEGLGCIYWHMVSKLLLAVGETIQREATPALIEHYRAIQAGIGAHKDPANYGSFPFDPYSHTPSMAGVQQPGMTGQVKEDILNRWFELGITVVDGEIHIDPFMLRREDFKNGEIRFTYCGTPFVYQLANLNTEGLNRSKGAITGEASNVTILDRDQSRHIFARDGEVKEIKVTVNL